MIYQVIAYFRSPDFVISVHRHLNHLTYVGDQSMFDMIQREMIEEVTGIPMARFMDTYHEKETFFALKNFLHAKKTMTCFCRVFMSKANKYVNPEGGMTDDKAKVSLPRNCKD
jgi:hypothetical protein